jgi:hypothetical protein
MKKTTESTPEVQILTPATAFKSGHPRLGGRRPGSLNKRTRRAIEICEAYDFHPAAVLIAVIQTGKLPNPDGSFAEVDIAGRMDALKTLCPYVMPRLQATQHSNDPEAPITPFAEFSWVMQDETLVAMCQDLALAMVDAEKLTLPRPDGPSDPTAECV